MKKFITLFCVFCLFLTNVSFAAAESYAGPAAFVVSKDNHLIGVRNTSEVVQHFPMYSSHLNTITGVKENGVVREKGLAEFVTINDIKLGLTTLNVTINIDSRYHELVKSLVALHTNGDEMSTDTIIASTYYVNKGYIGHMFYSEPHNVLVVGTVYFKNQRLPVMLCVGDFYHNGTRELGFMARNPFLPSPSEVTTSEQAYEVDTSEKTYTK